MDKVKERAVYVNGVWFPSIPEAARYLSRELKRNIDAKQVQAALEFDRPLGDMRVSREQTAQKEAPRLLRYPKGEAPWERGLPKSWH
jgi:hypothetical protein